jgi:hypothetical protein
MNWCVGNQHCKMLMPENTLLNSVVLPILQSFGDGNNLTIILPFPDDVKVGRNGIIFKVLV